MTIIDSLLRQLFNGETVAWPEGFGEKEKTLFLDACESHEICSLVFERLQKFPSGHAWPTEVLQALRDEMEADLWLATARKNELRKVLETLSDEKIDPILLKGMPLSFLIYEQAYHRPSFDTDLLIRKEDVPHVNEVMKRLGYQSPRSMGGELIQHQFSWIKKESEDLQHVFDFHWKIANPQMFSQTLTWEEAEASSIPVLALGSRTRSLSFIHALLLACVHRVAHHANEERLIWLYDIHLLTHRLSPNEFQQFVDLAKAKKMWTICNQGLQLAHHWFGTQQLDTNLVGARHAVPAHSVELSAEYLKLGHPRLRDFIFNFKIIPSWNQKIKYLREVALPSADYMLEKYSAKSYLWLPWLYLRRGVSGVLKATHEKK